MASKNIFTTRNMKVTLLMAITLDGKIGKDSNHFPDWTEKADKKLFVEKTKEAGALIMGHKTFETIGQPLAGRKNVILTRWQRKYEGREHDDYIPCENGNEFWLRWQREDLVFTNCSPKKVLKELEKQGFKEVILAGGAKINTLFLEAGLIDEVLVTICPKVFGSGISIFAPEISMDLQLEKVEKLGENSILAKYKVIK